MPRCTSSWLALALAALAGLAAALLLTSPAQATPLYAIRAANACDTCHIEPLGWANPPESDRRCSMDCRGCHVSPTGGGLRTPAGLYYGREVLPMFGTRPSLFANPEQYRPQGAPNKGRARFNEDFSGWWPGSIPSETIAERYGDINPNPTLRAGFDIRTMFYLPTAGENDAAIFPMQSDFHLAWQPSKHITGYVSGGLTGRRREDNILADANEVKDEREWQDYLTVREAFVMADDLPDNSYVRAGRFVPPGGWRVPDHTTFVRRDTQLNQYRSVFGVEAGWNPNYPHVEAAAYYQGLDGWPGDQNDKGLGASVNGGWRDLTWQLGGSLSFLKRLDDGAPNDVITGVQYGLNLYPLVLLGELNYKRSIATADDATSANGLIAYHEANLLITRGLSALLKYDWSDLDLRLKDDENHRITVGATWHPYTQFQLDVQYRRNWTGKHPLLDFTSSDLDEVLIMPRAWF